MADDYTTVAAVKADMDKTQADADAILGTMITEASRAIDRWANREDGWFVALAAATARTFAGTDTNVIRIPECVEVSTVKVKVSATADYDTWAATDWMAFNGSRYYPDFNTLPYTGLLVDPNGDYARFNKAGSYPTVEVTAKWGYSVAVPSVISAACKMQVIRWYKRRMGAMADSVATGDIGQLVYTRKLDPEVAILLESAGIDRPAMSSPFA